MPPFTLLITLFALLLATTTTTTTITALPTPTTSGNFSLTCTTISLTHNFFLGATCALPPSPADAGGSAVQSDDNQLDLTMCIGLDQVTGHMQWEVYGKFSNYCTNCTVQADRLLTCFCSPLVSRGQGSVRSTINLDEGITNDMGTLKCAGGMASAEEGSGEGGSCY